ncbi:MAG: hypothetical protein ACRDNO_03780, partial [Trebonia sp.]
FQGYQQQPPPYQPSYAPPHRQPRRKSRKGIGLGCGGLGALVVLIVILAAPHSSPPSSSSSSPAVGQSQAAAPASSAPAVAAVKTVATFSGSGIKNTPRFTVSSTWKLAYTYDCSAMDGTGNFIVDEDGGADLNGATVDELGAGGSSSTMVYGDAGTHYLQVNSECSWTVKVIDEG